MNSESAGTRLLDDLPGQFVQPPTPERAGTRTPDMRPIEHDVPVERLAFADDHGRAEVGFHRGGDRRPAILDQGDAGDTDGHPRHACAFGTSTRGRGAIA